MPIFVSYGSCAYKNSSAKFKQNILTFPFEIIVWPQKTAKMVSVGNIWNVFHLTTHEKRKTDQNYKKKHCITRHFFLEWLLYCKNITRSKQNIPHLLTSDIYVPHKTVLHSKKINVCEHRWVSRTCYVVRETKVPHHTPYNCIIRKKYESIFFFNWASRT